MSIELSGAPTFWRRQALRQWCAGVDMSGRADTTLRAISHNGASQNKAASATQQRKRYITWAMAGVSGPHFFRSHPTLLSPQCSSHTGFHLLRPPRGEAWIRSTHTTVHGDTSFSTNVSRTQNLSPFNEIQKATETSVQTSARR